MMQLAGTSFSPDTMSWDYSEVLSKPEWEAGRTYMPNRANNIHNYMLQHWPKLVNIQGVWLVGSTAYLLEANCAPTGDLDLICSNQLVLETVVKLVETSADARCRTYMGGERVYHEGKQVDVWTLSQGQTIDDAICGFSSTHPQARVAYELATGKLTVYPNANAL